MPFRNGFTHCVAILYNNTLTNNLMHRNGMNQRLSLFILGEIANTKEQLLCRRHTQAKGSGVFKNKNHMEEFRTSSWFLQSLLLGSRISKSMLNVSQSKRKPLSHMFTQNKLYVCIWALRGRQHGLK